MRVMFSYPAEVPTALLRALESRLAALPWVAAAYLGQMHQEGEAEPQLVVGIEATLPSSEAERLLHDAFAGLPAGLPAFQWTIMDPGDPIADALRDYPPFYRTKPRGFLARLFGRS